MSPLEVYKQVEEYVERQCKGNAKVINLKPEHTYNELGFSVTIWNVKTDNDGSWWVAQGGLPMNLYPQDKPYYFSTDEAFSFHLGIMLRLIEDEAEIPDDYIDYITNGVELNLTLRRKLSLASKKLSEAVEIEDIQSIGVICRETLIELIDYIYNSDSFNLENEFKKSDVKNRGDIIINKYLTGSKNVELRKYMRSLLNSAWDYSNTITHSSSNTKPDASICLTLTIALVSSFENILNKYFDPFAGLRCKNCGSRKLRVDEEYEDGELLIMCENCNQGFFKKPID